MVGAQKCGTSSLCSALTGHPDVYIPHQKEIHFFAKPAIFERGFPWYRGHFVGAGANQFVGEASTSYTLAGARLDAPRLLGEHLPESKLIYIVRHPLRRIESACMHLAREGYWRGPDLAESLRSRPNVLETSRYGLWLDRLRAHFPADRILVLFFEDWIADPAAVLRRVARFLGISEQPFRDAASAPHANASVGRPAQNAVTRFLLNAPGSVAIRSVLPEGVRSGVLRLVGSPPLTERFRLPPNLAARYAAELKPDAERVLAENGKPTDFWDLEPSRAARPAPPA